MEFSEFLYGFCLFSSVILMLGVALLSRLKVIPIDVLWRLFLIFSWCAVGIGAVEIFINASGIGPFDAFFKPSLLARVIAVLVQFLGTVVVSFSSRYLQGEDGQRGYVAALASLLASVEVLLMANHWLILIGAWALVGVALRHLLCFYPDRIFANLAVHKKQIADRVADGLLVGAASLAWFTVGSGSFSVLWNHIAHQGMSFPLVCSAIALVLAVMLRTALVPVHGWIIQVMEAPTPVSALLHAGVVNLGGFVLIEFSPMLEASSVARLLLFGGGLLSAIIAGMVMLTRISIKVRLAWSTVAQMGFMLLECALGLYTFAALHLIGHSLYKAYAFLSASSVVRSTRLKSLSVSAMPNLLSVLMAPVFAFLLVIFMLFLFHAEKSSWPWWWTAVIGLACGPLLWFSSRPLNLSTRIYEGIVGIFMVMGLAAACLLTHFVPLGIQNQPHNILGIIALSGMLWLYIFVMLLHFRPEWLSRWRRWSYAGFYLDEAYTRLALKLFPAEPAFDQGYFILEPKDMGHAMGSSEIKALEKSPVFSAEMIDRMCDQACQSIAPAWPLDQSIAVNPYWKHTHLTVSQVAVKMAVLGGVRVFPSREDQQKAWEAGRITLQDLTQALDQLAKTQPKALTLTPETCILAMQSTQKLKPLPLLIDLLESDPRRNLHLAWREAVTHQISQTCAAYFDEHQAEWKPDRHEGLYVFFRETLQHDHSIHWLTGLSGMHRAFELLPATAAEAENWAIHALGLSENRLKDYLEALLLSLKGWSSSCAYLGWQASLEGREDKHLRELLSIRLSWDALLLQCTEDSEKKQTLPIFRKIWEALPEYSEKVAEELLIDEVWQLALEIGYQNSVAKSLVNSTPITKLSSDKAYKLPLQAQAVFCIDVRSEPLRRAIEAINPLIQTIGFAGFFGLPIRYRSLGAQTARAQLPGLLAPSMTVMDRIVPVPQKYSGEATDHLNKIDETREKAAIRARDHWFNLQNRRESLSRWPGSAFFFVEAAGLAYVGALWRALFPQSQHRPQDELAGLSRRDRVLCRPQWVGVDLAQKIELAAKTLHAMGLRSFAPLVLFVGHGSQSTNNPYASSLDCGACCGQTGEVNARMLAMLLNEPEVRRGLKLKDIMIPEETYFLAGLHNTTTDEIEAFDLDLLSDSAKHHWHALKAIFEQASEHVRLEREPTLNLSNLSLSNLSIGQSSNNLLEMLRRRANDGAQTRPEWGLAGNAMFMIAPRHKTAAVNLGGRSFLHDYDATQDLDGSILELLMTAPMVVAHWINWQYHASTADPRNWGSGNKLLHNVVGGSLGVFEGNGGDLRVGLSRQSLHDGKQWRHEPLRLTVIIDAPAEAIEKIIQKHAVLTQLIENHWIHLWRFESAGFSRYERDRWLKLEVL